METLKMLMSIMYKYCIIYKADTLFRPFYILHYNNIYMVFSNQPFLCLITGTANSSKLKNF